MAMQVRKISTKFRAALHILNIQIITKNMAYYCAILCYNDLYGKRLQHVNNLFSEGLYIVNVT